eukprot:TRINITY_DN778164_c0_g1_i1.p1 TRINITY_DN778164_c0_g1~~TRINITY_DN778164_c0_g1_i1.p1  ORF type:complete len:159 (+),score=17.42 TRINITY_DN778164_c0_g1_i1:50-478(+)
MIKFLIVVNRQAQTRVSRYFDFLSMEERSTLEPEIVRKCLSRTEKQCSFMEYRDYKVIYKRFASLYFIVGVDNGEENELGVLEFIQALVETLDKLFDNVCELHLMFNLEKVHFVIDEMIMSGCIMETNQSTILRSVKALERK